MQNPELIIHNHKDVYKKKQQFWIDARVMFSNWNMMHLLYEYVQMRWESMKHKRIKDPLVLTLSDLYTSPVCFPAMTQQFLNP